MCLLTHPKPRRHLERSQQPQMDGLQTTQILRNDCPLDRSEGQQMEAAPGSSRIQTHIRGSQWMESWAVLCRIV